MVSDEQQVGTLLQCREENSNSSNSITNKLHKHASNVNGQHVRVVFVERHNAKAMKNRLQQLGWLHQQFRMTKVITVDGSIQEDSRTTTASDDIDTDTADYSNYIGCIAIPILSRLVCEHQQNNYPSTTPQLDDVSSCMIKGFGHYFCPYSTSILGNDRRLLLCSPPTTSSSSIPTTIVPLVSQQNQIIKGLYIAVSNYLSDKVEMTELLTTAQQQQQQQQQQQTDDIMTTIQQLDVKTCPNHLELFGDDRTLVIPLQAFNPYLDEHNKDYHGSKLKYSSSSSSNGFQQFMQDILRCCTTNQMDYFLDHYLWKQLAFQHKSPRVVRRGMIDPNSPIRQSCFHLLWTKQTGTNKNIIETGPGSPGWIQVTEQGIRQSFDFTRVMFSRGNITEKIRFGKLVQPGEVLLDMYAGIGYFTLPALIHGQASHVYCCEWNPDALEALRYNLYDNGVAHRATVYSGDCRQIITKENLVNKVDRVVLGLLPSSEGGWRSAAQALRRSTGGWLHVHGNVPVQEVTNWVTWLCCCLRDYIHEMSMQDQWFVLSYHVEKVKSFAPTINHYVCDVFIGPPIQMKEKFPLDILQPGTAMYRMTENNNRLLVCPQHIASPSCALSPTGILHQQWMREI